MSLKELKYTLKFPTLEFEAIHAHQAKLDALKYFKDHLIEIEWTEAKE